MGRTPIVTLVRESGEKWIVDMQEYGFNMQKYIDLGFKLVTEYDPSPPLEVGVSVAPEDQAIASAPEPAPEPAPAPVQEPEPEGAEAPGKKKKLIRR